MPTEFLICGASASVLTASLELHGITVFDPSGIHSRILKANGLDGSSDDGAHAQLSVPIVPGSVWTRLSQIVSRQRSGSIRWAVAADDLALFVPLWMHLMPAAHIVSVPADADADQLDKLEQRVKELLHV